MRRMMPAAASRPVIAVCVGVLALVAAVAGTGIAANPGVTTSAVSKKAVKKLVRKEVRRQISKATGPQGPQGEPGAPATALFAAVDANGDSGPHKGLEEVIHTGGSGTYMVVFDRDVDNCVPIASLSHDDLGFVQASTQGGGTDAVTVYTATENGILGDEAFNVAVFC